MIFCISLWTCSHFHLLQKFFSFFMRSLHYFDFLSISIWMNNLFLEYQLSLFFSTLRKAFCVSSKSSCFMVKMASVCIPSYETIIGTTYKIFIKSKSLDVKPWHNVWKEYQSSVRQEIFAVKIQSQVPYWLVSYA